MAFWRRKEDEYSEMVELIEQQPGISARELAQQLDVSPSTITRRLPSLDDAGVLLAEDDKGGLWPRGKRKGTASVGECGGMSQRAVLGDRCVCRCVQSASPPALIVNIATGKGRKRSPEQGIEQSRTP